MTIEMLLELLNGMVDPTKYDFVCLPWDGGRKASLTMAFINFIDHTTARQVFEAFDGLVLYGGRVTGRIHTCQSHWSHTQGLRSNLAFYFGLPGRSSLDAAYAPRVFENGVHISLESALLKHLGIDIRTDNESQAGASSSSNTNRHQRELQGGKGSSARRPGAAVAGKGPEFAWDYPHVVPATSARSYASGSVQRPPYPASSSQGPSSCRTQLQ
jgi:hypothetical protein